MKLLVLGGNGMAGHVLVRYLRTRTAHRVLWTSRDPHDRDALQLDVADPERVLHLLDAAAPDVVVNTVGVLNAAAADDPPQAYRINGLLPHLLRERMSRSGGKVVHISTDCVFSGQRGGYAEHDDPDGTSVYARSKALGESHDSRHLTIRTSIIGPEIRPEGIGLMRWFMAQRGEVRGYTQVMWNGVTTLELAQAVHRYLEAGLGGLVHLTAPETLSKHELLQKMAHIWKRGEVRLVPDDEVRLDRTLVNTRRDLPYAAPGYDEMLEALHTWMTAP
ncbi:sugar nucleotide-binding protein [Paenibacillus sp. IB182496]|uniref:dTDP-4-dehydrorhamnose reductase n=1 Tax=Paenibacillus sabuli TaxID=2772509 RepID=A0A927BVT1_9BACL|nr:sugar nucleotide-binding protein [Paenibacillus sabuli]MBD2846424.1 sugar nucleotide-binding protein [Paenibacillus sabuli]